MNERELIDDSFENHKDVLEKTLAKHSKNIAKAAKLINTCFRDGGKLVVFGNGGSAADSQHIVAEFVGHFLNERKSLPAITLTTDSSILTSLGNDYGFGKIFERQVESLVNYNDVVMAISTSGNSENVINGIVASKNKGAKIIALSGDGGGRLSPLVDILIDIPSCEVPRIQEMHILIGHILVNIVELNFISSGETKNIL